MEDGIMKRFFRLLLSVIPALAILGGALLAGGTAQAQQTLYKYIGPDGKTVYSDKPPPPGVKFEKLQPNTAPTGVNLRSSPAAAEEADAAIRARGEKQVEKEQRVANLQKAYDAAVAALEAAKTPEAGERTANATTVSSGKKGSQTTTNTSRLNDDYFARIDDLQQQVDQARDALNAAKNESAATGINRPPGPRLQDFARLFKPQARVAREQLRHIAVTQIAQKIRFHFAVREKLRVEPGVVESRHRAAIQPDCARRDNHVGALQRAVAKHRALDQRLVAYKPAPRVDLRK
jgi:hypothetical protein